MAQHLDVMVSSTYSDLIEHRSEAFDALYRLGFYAYGMEYDSSKAGQTIVDSSMGMVDKAEAYVGIISHRYGGVPNDAKRNPKGLSITELEYRQALSRGMPVYMFLMSDTHPIVKDGVESVKANSRKLESLRKDARKRSICVEFSSVLELKSLILQSLSELRTRSDEQAKSTRRMRGTVRRLKPPKLLAIPDFVSGHDFIGRGADLDELDQWAASNDPLMVIEAIGGAGKSALAWHWMKSRPQSAGTVWYSFYEGGADMSAFVANTLAYLTGRPLKELRGRNATILSAELLSELHKSRSLLVLDGLERVLAAYHRLDASQARDDQIESGLEHCACTRPEDGELLFRLVAAGPTKILVTSRLMPTALTNASHHPLPGVRHRCLPGMIPDDAMRMMRGLGVRGNDGSMSRYLTENFDNHPLLLGIVAGLVRDYVRDPGNFDRWVEDPQGGAALRLSKLDLKKRRTHILAAALNGLKPNVRRLLSRIAALSDAVAFEIVEALSPFRQQDEAMPRLVSALQDLERRGLLQWDRRRNLYDLHPVVRGYVFDTLDETERKDISNQIVEHFQSKPADRYDRVEIFTDVQQSVNIFRALIHANRFEDAASFWQGGLAIALLVSVEAPHQVLALLKPFFPHGFQIPPNGLANPGAQGHLLNNVGTALGLIDRPSEAQAALSASLRLYLTEGRGAAVVATLLNLAGIYLRMSRLGTAMEVRELALIGAETWQDHDHASVARLELMSQYTDCGLFERANAAYEAFRLHPAPSDPKLYRRGHAERLVCRLRLYQGVLTAQLLNEADAAARAGRDKSIIRDLHRLRGESALQCRDFSQAITSFAKYIEMTQAAGMDAANVEARIAVAEARSGDHTRARRTLDRIRGLARGLELAEVHLELGDQGLARRYALAGYVWAWADGPAYSRWWELERCRTVLGALGEPDPALQAYDPKSVEPIPYAAEIRKLIASRRGTSALGNAK